MLSKKEIGAIAMVAIVLAFTISLLASIKIFLWTLLGILVVILINISAKKVAGYYFESDIEIKLWEIQRYGLMGALTQGRMHPSQEFRRPLPAGLIFPLVLIAVSFGYIKWMACLVFDIKPKVYRAARRHGLYKFSEITEDHIGYIAAAGVVANIIFGIIFYFIGYPDLARWNIYFAFFSILPLSDLDGNKIFFGNFVLWTTLLIVLAIALGYAFFLI